MCVTGGLEGGGGLVFELCTVCVADIDKSPGRRVKLGMVALVCEVAPGERQTGKREKKGGAGRARRCT